jgi:predicted O-methyltransferase YrrM
MSELEYQQSIPGETGRMPAKQLDPIMRELDHWVSKHGNGSYVDPGDEPLKNWGIPPDYGIQQERREIAAFTGKLLELGVTSGTALEIGLGYYGSTHFLWRLLFDRVITIEKNHDRVHTFGRNTREHYGKWVMDDGRSAFMVGLSREPGVVANVYQHVDGQVDLLFIDGDHAYGSVLTDWLLYHPLVRPGGIVAFHDSLLAIPGYYAVPAFIEQLRAGTIDGRGREIHNVAFSKSLGIAWYQQT